MKAKKGVSHKKSQVNTEHTRFLKKIGKTSAQRSITESKALGLAITYLENGKIIREEADGKKTILEEI